MATVNLSAIRYSLVAILSSGGQISLETVAQNIAWEENEKELAVRLNITVRDVSHNGKQIASQLALCTAVILYYDIGSGPQEAFRGTIWSWAHSQVRGDEIIITAYDMLYYDAEGNPSIFCRFPKMKSSDFDPLLPDHLHPAFRINNSEEDALIGKYMASELESSGTQYSLPNMPPRVSMAHDTFLAKMRAFGNGASGITIADHGLILLLAHLNKWEPRGNNYWGCDYRDATPWELAKEYTIGTVRSFRGWTYECLKTHTSAAELLPIDSPTYWKKLKHVGGTPAAPSQYNADSRYQGYNTLTGSGPLNWYLGSDPGNLCDVQGNAFEQVYGFRLVNCEIQILGDNNNAADASCDCSANSPEWKAILPSKTDHSYTLVAPGTPGTLHYTWQNGKITIDTVEPEFDQEYRGTTFKDMAVNTANILFMPSIMYELGLAPIPGTTVQGYFYVQMTEAERVARRGGDYLSTSHAGVASLYCHDARSSAGAYCGARPRSRLNP